jgi:hypothetical protein
MQNALEPNGALLTVAQVATLLLLVFALPAGAQATATVEEFFTGILAISDSKCQRRGDVAEKHEREGRWMEAGALRDAEAMMCECLPKRMREAHAGLSRQDRSRRLTEAEFTKRFLSQFLAPCTGETIRRPYADDCVKRFARLKPDNTAKWCSCMSREVATLTDAEALAMSLESADYVPAAAAAKKQGRPEPVKPPLLTRMAEMEAACSRD